MSGYSSVDAPATASLTESPNLQPGEICSTLNVSASGGSPAGCRAWRSCRSCLQKIGCMVNPLNQCTSQNDPIAGYNPNMDYRKAIASNMTVTNATISDPQALASAQYWQFPAIETKYCAVDDTVCTQCKQASFYRTSGQLDSRFCVGAGGCVCIFSCEYTSGAASLADCGSTTSTPAPSPSSYYVSPSPSRVFIETSPSSTVILLIPCVVFLVLGILLVTFATKERAKRRQEEEVRVRRARAARTLAHAPRTAAIGVTGLALSGWNQHRQQLVADENLQLAGAGDVDSSAYAQLRSPKNTATLAPASRTTPVQQSSQTSL